MPQTGWYKGHADLRKYSEADLMVAGGALSKIQDEPCNSDCWSGIDRESIGTWTDACLGVMAWERVVTDAAKGGSSKKVTYAKKLLMSVLIKMRTTLRPGQSSERLERTRIVTPTGMRAEAANTTRGQPFKVVNSREAGRREAIPSQNSSLRESLGSAPRRRGSVPEAIQGRGSVPVAAEAEDTVDTDATDQCKAASIHQEAKLQHGDQSDGGNDFETWTNAGTRAEATNHSRYEASWTMLLVLCSNSTWFVVQWS